MSMRFICLLVCLAIVGCGDSTVEHSDNEEGGHHHHHEPPHGGIPVVLGDEAFHLELLHDAENGQLKVYLLDGHMENFVRIKAEAFTIKADVDGEVTDLVFNAQASNATGETVGDSSLFIAENEFLKTATKFKAIIPELVIGEQTFSNVEFPFPEGNDSHHHH